MKGVLVDTLAGGKEFRGNIGKNAGATGEHKLVHR